MARSIHSNFGNPGGAHTRVLIASKILLVAAYRRKLMEIAAQPQVERLVAIVPPYWREPGGRVLAFEAGPSPGYELRIEPVRFNGRFHLFYWPALGRAIRDVQPDVVHLDEEPYNLATALGTWHARRAAARSIFFTWQNLHRRYPPPFSLFERYVFASSAFAIAGNADALAVIRAKGYVGPATVIPQFGIDPDLFAPAVGVSLVDEPTIGFVGRLVEEKGLLVLIDALARLSRAWRLCVIGDGPLLGRARARADQLGIGSRIAWEGSIASMEVASRMRTFDIFVLPSQTRSNWKEQFGRALVEAMACGVAVVGSDSGEIPRVIGDAGMVVPEGDAAALAAALETLLAELRLRRELGQKGRQRVLDNYTHRRVGEATVAAYSAALGGAL